MQPPDGLNLNDKFYNCDWSRWVKKDRRATFFPSYANYTRSWPRTPIRTPEHSSRLGDQVWILFTHINASRLNIHASHNTNAQGCTALHIYFRLRNLSCLRAFPTWNSTISRVRLGRMSAQVYPFRADLILRNIIKVKDSHLRQVTLNRYVTTQLYLNRNNPFWLLKFKTIWCYHGPYQVNND